MRTVFENLRQKESFEKIILLQKAHMCCAFLALLVQWGVGFISFISLVFWIFGLTLYFYYYQQSLRNLFYTFWTLSIILGCYYFYSLWSYGNEFKLFILYLFNLIALAINSYSLLSPVYYPVVTWWEYDFRYRSDLKINIKKGGSYHEARLTDLRRGAGCIVAFESFKLGEELEIETSGIIKKLNLIAEFVSKRENIAGRGYSYGVRVRFHNMAQKKMFNDFTKEWHRYKKMRKDLRFKEKDQHREELEHS